MVSPKILPRVSPAMLWALTRTTGKGFTYTVAELVSLFFLSSSGLSRVPVGIRSANVLHYPKSANEFLQPTASQIWR
jgi:hypothetical protein